MAAPEPAAASSVIVCDGDAAVNDPTYVPKVIASALCDGVAVVAVIAASRSPTFSDAVAG
jgi:hypothetical protein